MCLVFSDFLSKTLDSFPLDPETIKILKEGQQLYRQAFTHPSADPVYNYQILEQLGDVAIGKFMVQYFYERFRHLNTTPGVKIVARLRIKYGSQQELSQLAEDLHFWDYIDLKNGISSSVRKAAIMEDVFEAFIGATEVLLNQAYSKSLQTKIHSLGYECVYAILKFLFDRKPITLTYEHLFDAKTRLKELCDSFSQVEVKYKIKKIPIEEIEAEDIVESQNFGTRIEIYLVKDGGEQLIGSACSAVKCKAEQTAAEVALETLKRLGYTKPVTKEYQELECIN